MREILYNKQTDNEDFNGKFAGSRQCFSTSAWMLLGYLAPETYQGDNDEQLTKYVDDVETKVGEPGVAEAVKKEHRDVTGWTSLWWAVQKAGIEKWMAAAGKNGEVVFHDASFPLGNLEDQLADGPIIIGTKNLGGLPGGHIILLVDHEGDDFICHDPFGDAKTHYDSGSGKYVRYKKNWIKPYIAYHGNGNVRCMFWKPAA